MTTAVDWKAKGNASFSSGQFSEAVQCFTEAIKLSPNDHVLYSNRSGAYASMDKYDLALEDASKCITLKPDWPKVITTTFLLLVLLTEPVHVTFPVWSYMFNFI